MWDLLPFIVKVRHLLIDGPKWKNGSPTAGRKEYQFNWSICNASFRTN